jgi:hypothetical protein
MPNSRRKALTTYRRRLKRRGVVRLEVHVRKDDAALVRGVVTALADPEREVRRVHCCASASDRESLMVSRRCWLRRHSKESI